MDGIYFDQASTSFPKGKNVVESMAEFMACSGTNMDRGKYQSAYSTGKAIYEARKHLCRFFDLGPEKTMAKNVVFTTNVTYALNLIIKGYLKEGDHVLISSMEHNAVLRPLVQMEKKGILSFDKIPCNQEGELCISEIEKLIKTNTRAIIMTHGSNVSGTIMPIEKVGEIAHKNGLVLIVDSAQTAGFLPISMREMHIDALAFTGHKGLLGPQGIGGFLISDSMAKEMTPLILGGTGNVSDSEDMPDFLPDKFEAGTMNLPGIIGLNQGISFIEEVGLDNIREKELELTRRFIEGIEKIEGIKLIGKKSCVGRTPVVSIQCDFMDEAVLADVLDKEHGVMTRVGLQCAPSAHQALGTYPRGTLRFSFGYENNKEEVDYVIDVINKLCL